MELWIRSQYKDILIKVDNLIIDDEKPKIYTHNYINNMQMTYTLGEYETRGRTLEVLDEIQRTMAKTLDCIIDQMDNCIVGCNTLVLYEMPKE